MREVNIPQELPPEIPGKKDDAPYDTMPSVPATNDIDDDSGEEWRLDNDEDYASTLPAMFSQTVSSPLQAMNTAAGVVADTTTQAMQAIKEQSTNTYTLLNKGHWYGRSPAEYIATVRQ